MQIWQLERPTPRSDRQCQGARNHANPVNPTNRGSDNMPIEERIRPNAANPLAFSRRRLGRDVRNTGWVSGPAPTWGPTFLRHADRQRRRLLPDRPIQRAGRDALGTISPELRIFFTVGFLGSYTTFSSFGFETIALLRLGSPGLGLLNLLADLLAGFAAVVLGLYVGRLLS